MKTTPEHDKRMADMKFSSVYPHYPAKIEKKGRSKEELQHRRNFAENYWIKSIFML